MLLRGKGGEALLRQKWKQHTQEMFNANGEMRRGVKRVPACPGHWERCGKGGTGTWKKEVHEDVKGGTSSGLA